MRRLSTSDTAACDPVRHMLVRERLLVSCMRRGVSMAREGGSQQLTVTRQETASSYALAQKPCMPSTVDVLDSAHWESAQAWLYRSRHGRREAHALTRTALSMELEDVMQLDALPQLVSQRDGVRNLKP